MDHRNPSSKYTPSSLSFTTSEEGALKLLDHLKELDRKNRPRLLEEDRKFALKLQETEEDEFRLQKIKQEQEDEEIARKLQEKYEKRLRKQAKKERKAKRELKEKQEASPETEESLIQATEELTMNNEEIHHRESNESDQNSHSSTEKKVKKEKKSKKEKKALRNSDPDYHHSKNSDNNINNSIVDSDSNWNGDRLHQRDPSSDPPATSHSKSKSKGKQVIESPLLHHPSVMRNRSLGDSS